ncbi:hypothetical protein ACGFX4_06475 [Kitasatospora sp. NPDC048365]|uniref:hypothetical protein n=1 Tax=Kitasatospora sp. NPDC048365 TaxID=3364050 RepID=UPI00371FE6D5
MSGVDEDLKKAGQTDGVVDDWLCGLADNPALPGSVLKRLLEFDELPTTTSWLDRRPLDIEATGIAVSARQTEYRLDAVSNPTADVDVLARLAHDPVPRVRYVYAALLTDFGRRIPEGVAETLAADPTPGVRRMTADCPQVPLAVRERLAADEHPDVRAVALTPVLWEVLPPAARERLLDDPSPRVREKAAELSRPPEQPAALTAAERVAHPDRWTRQAAAADPDVPRALAVRLAGDPENGVRLALSMREDLSEEERLAIPCEVVAHELQQPTWIAERATDPEAALRIAGSAHVGLRRVLARQPRLPDAVVARLAADPDPWVRNTLCHFCEDAPHELLLEEYAAARDRHWLALRAHRNFARPGLARFADDPDPRLRHLALADPQADRLLLLRLADDPAVAGRAIGDPRFPVDELLRRLARPESARAAARNPVLPQATMHRLVDLAQHR